MIELHVLELVYIPNFNLNWQFWFFGRNLSKKDISGRKEKKWTSPLNSAILDIWEWFSSEIFLQSIFRLKSRLIGKSELIKKYLTIRLLDGLSIIWQKNFLTRLHRHSSSSLIFHSYSFSQDKNLQAHVH